MVGIGADGCAGLGATARQVQLSASLVIGGDRQQSILAYLPGQGRRRGLTPPLPDLLAEHDDRRVIVTACGDRLRSGVGTTLPDHLGIEQVRIIPAVSCGDLARARLGCPAESADGLTVVGRAPAHRAGGRRPEALAGLAAPGSVFVGGGTTVTAVIDTCSVQWLSVGPWFPASQRTPMPCWPVTTDRWQANSSDCRWNQRHPSDPSPAGHPRVPSPPWSITKGTEEEAP